MHLSNKIGDNAPTKWD